MEAVSNTVIANELNLSSSKKFDERFFVDSTSLTKEEKKNLISDLTKQYKVYKAEIKSEIAQDLVKLKEVHDGEMKKIDDEMNAHLATIEEKFKDVDLKCKENKALKVEYDNSVKGALIIAKRAKIKENNNYDHEIKTAKLKEFFLHEDYVQIKKRILNQKISFDSAISGFIERKAEFSLKSALKNKQMWVNLIPLFMLIFIAIIYVILAYTVNNGAGYGGESLWDKLDDIINNGVFVAVVATGAIFIYSGGSFDMSLGPASLMCATIAAIVYNSTHNIALSCIVSISLGALLGIVNAILANVLNLPVMVMTLTMMNILNSIHAVILQTQGNELRVDSGMPGNTIVYATFLVCFFLLCWAIFNYTKLGRRNKLIGSNATAAKFSGVNLMKAGIISFAISGVGLGICGFLYASYRSGASFSTGTLLDSIGLNVVIAIVFGGMTTSGGPRSRVSCAVIGAFFCMFLDEIFRAVGAADYRFLVKGIVFLTVSFFNMYSSRTKMLAR